MRKRKWLLWGLSCLLTLPIMCWLYPDPNTVTISEQIVMGCTVLGIYYILTQIACIKTWINAEPKDKEEDD